MQTTDFRHVINNGRNTMEKRISKRKSIYLHHNCRAITLQIKKESCDTNVQTINVQC